MKNGIKYILQKALGYQRYLLLFARFKIKRLRQDKKEGDFFAFLEEIETDGDILDIGANIGIMSVHLARLFPERLIHCVEPEPNNLLTLKRVIEFYGLKNTRIYPLAVGDKGGEIEMVLPEEKSVKMQGLTHVVHKSIDEWNEGKTFMVRAAQLDALFADRRIAAIKMDIENFEFFALKGARKILEQDHPVIYLELWKNENRTQCFDLLKDLGYETFVVENNKLVKFKVEIHQNQNFIFKYSTN